MCAEFYGNSNGSFFSFESINKNRHIEWPMMPDNVSALLPAATKIKIMPKQVGEIRILSADIALMASTRYKNDATAIFINQCLPTKVGRYMCNIIHQETNEGFHTEAEALKIRQLYEQYHCDYIVLDTRNVGLSVYDALARDITDPETGEVYPALSSCNNAEMAARCTSKSADKVIWCVQGSSKFNSDCALLLREGFRTGRIRLPISEYDAEEMYSGIKGFASLSPSDKLTVMMEYINTTLLINELINLRHEESGGLVRVFEKSGMRKDRYSSLSYNYYVSLQLEKDMRKLRQKAYDSSTDAFIFRAPKTGRR